MQRKAHFRMRPFCQVGYMARLLETTLLQLRLSVPLFHVVSNFFKYADSLPAVQASLTKQVSS